MGKQSRRESRRNRPQRRKTPSPRLVSTDAGLRLIVATSPGSTEDGRFLADDLELVRASLLYADTVELLSPAAVMVGAVAAMQGADEEVWISALEQVNDETLAYLGLVTPPDEFRAALSGIRALHGLPREEKRRRLGPRYAEIQSLFRRFRTTLDEPGGVRDMAGALVTQAQVPELDEAIEAGVLSVSFDFMTLEADTDTQIREYTAYLKSLLTSPNTHLLLDERMSGIAEALMREEEVVPSAATLTRAIRSRIGTGLVAHLPVFPGASISAILEARAELESPLAKYRGGVRRLSESIQSEPFANEVEHEIADMWRDEVVPSVESLRREMSKTRVARDTAARLGENATAAIQATGLFFGVETFTEASRLMAGATAAAPVLSKAVAGAYRDFSERREQVKGSEFFYLLQLGQRLR